MYLSVSCIGLLLAHFGQSIDSGAFVYPPTRMNQYDRQLLDPPSKTLRQTGDNVEKTQDTVNDDSNENADTSNDTASEDGSINKSDETKTIRENKTTITKPSNVTENRKEPGVVKPDKAKNPVQTKDTAETTNASDQNLKTEIADSLQQHAVMFSMINALNSTLKTTVHIGIGDQFSIAPVVAYGQQEIIELQQLASQHAGTFTATIKTAYSHTLNP